MEFWDPEFELTMNVFVLATLSAFCGAAGVVAAEAFRPNLWRVREWVRRHVTDRPRCVAVEATDEQDGAEKVDRLLVAHDALASPTFRRWVFGTTLARLADAVLNAPPEEPFVEGERRLTRKLIVRVRMPNPHFVSPKG
jgi:hypothetical protein